MKNLTHDDEGKVQRGKDPLDEQWIDLRLVSAMRLMLAASALFVTFVDPTEPSNYVTLTYASLITYTLYSGIIFFIAINSSDLIPSRLMHWVDLLWYLTLMALSSGSNSIFFNFIFFAILVSSFGWGYKEGVRLTMTSAVLFTIVGLLATTGGVTAELNRLLLRPIQILILGFMIARWGGFKVNLRKRLQVLKDVSLISNPRFGIDRTINAFLERLRSFYDADACLLLIPTADGKFQLYRVRRGVPPSGAPPPPVTTDAVGFFMLPSPEFAVLHRKDGDGQTQLFNMSRRVLQRGDSTVGDRISSALETTSYLSVPVHWQESGGRLYVVGGLNHFDGSDIDFVVQLMDHVTPLIENTRLIDSLATFAAEEERRRIARDIHDSVIQPYVGLQLGITALAQKLKSGNTDVLGNAEELLDLTNQELIELRRYVWGLRAGEERRDVLLPAIDRFITRFASVTGINVDVTTRGKIEVNDRLAAELFQMVAEGLSNVRRHALCNEAKINIGTEGGKLLLEIKNRRPESSGDLNAEGQRVFSSEPLFTPRSIAERASLLGGETIVSIDEKNYTVVTVAIPL